MNAVPPIEVRLRDVEPEDLPRFFEQQADPEAVAMAQVAPRDRDAFLAHWSGILADPGSTVKTVVWGGPRPVSDGVVERVLVLTEAVARPG